jgi:FkbM family methyltransferase
MKSRARIQRELSERWLGLRLSMTGRMHQYPEILALRQLITRFEITHVLDVGANVGQYATMLRHDVRFGGVIHSFEPNPQARSALSARASRDPRWHIHPFALSHTDGAAAFHIMDADQFSSLHTPNAGQDAIFSDHNRVNQQVTVETRRLDTTLATLAIPADARILLKLDTQGHDHSVCLGAGTALSRMIAVQTELSIRPLYDGATDWHTMLGFLAGAGFSPSALFANNEGHFPLLVEMDGLFIREASLQGRTPPDR